MRRSQAWARSWRIIWLALRMTVELALLARRERRLPRVEFERLEEDLLRRQAVRLRRTALDLQGLLIKLGQFLSTRVDVLPPAFTGELAGLQDAVPPVAARLVRAQVERELGRSLESVFATFEDHPVASASLGQVHLATLAGGGTVAVKVQRPGIEQIIAIDLEAVRTVARFARHLRAVRSRVDLMALFRELERTTLEELDYVAEAGHAERFRANFAAREDVVVPGIRREWSTRRVLVMEAVQGRRLDDREGLLQVGVDPLRTADLLVQTYAQQVLRDGFFHADPHPGNVFADDRGRLIYVDFGMMGSISPDDRATFGRLVGAVIRRDYGAIVDCIQDLGFIRPQADTRVLKRALALMIDHLARMPLNRLSVAQSEEFLAELRQFLHEEPFQLPTQYTFLGRAIGILLGMTTTLDPEVDFVRLLRQNALPYLEGGESNSRPGLGREAIVRELRATALLLYRLPSRLDRFLEMAESGELRLHVDLGPLRRAVQDRARSLDHLSAALLTAASGLVATWFTTAGRLPDARAAWIATAVLLVWTWRRGRPRGR